MSLERLTRKNESQTSGRVGKWVKAASVGRGKWMGRLKNEKGTPQNFTLDPVLTCVRV